MTNGWTTATASLSDPSLGHVMQSFQFDFNVHFFLLLDESSSSQTFNDGINTATVKGFRLIT